MRRWGDTLIVAGAAVGIVLVLYHGLPVLLFGALGIFLGIAYSAPPLKLASRGMGESAVALGFGVLPVGGAAWLQAGFISWQALLLSLPVSIWIANVLLINEIPDITADRMTGKLTVPVRWGVRLTGYYYLASNLAAVGLLGVAVALGYLNATALSLSCIMLLPAFHATTAIRHWNEKPQMMEGAIKLTLAIHAVNCLWLLGWIIVVH